MRVRVSQVDGAKGQVTSQKKMRALAETRSNLRLSDRSRGKLLTRELRPTGERPARTGLRWSVPGQNGRGFGPRPT